MFQALREDPTEQGGASRRAACPRTAGTALWQGTPTADPARQRIKLTSPNLVSFCDRLPDGTEEVLPPA